jgi:MFS family permease
MKAFTIIWVGQLLSLLGTAISNFGMQFWVFEASEGKATPMTMIGVAFFIPMVIFSPFVGVLVDRANRKLMMMLSDLAAAFTTLVVLILFVTGELQIWHLYITAFVGGTFQGFQWPAYSAAISTMLDKKDYTRANAMLDMAGASSQVVAPIIAGAILGPLGLVVTRTLPALAGQVAGDPGLLALLAIDLLSAAFAIGTLLFVHIPQPETSAAGQEAGVTFFQQAIFGFQYIVRQPSLLGLQLVFMAGNFFYTLGTAVQAPMILARTDSDTLVFGSIQTAGALGSIAGALILGAWGGFQRRVHGVLIGWALSGLTIIGVGASQALVPWLVTGFVAVLFAPLINASNQAIWQAKVPPDVQGRVFASRRMIAWGVAPVSRLLAGPLADRVLEPAFTTGDGMLARVFGTGPGAGMGFQLAVAGVLTALIGLGGYLFPIVRNAEDLLPDHDQTDAATKTTEPAVEDAEVALVPT